jgi:hypothetical protein
MGLGLGLGLDMGFGKFLTSQITYDININVVYYILLRRSRDAYMTLYDDRTTTVRPYDDRTTVRRPYDRTTTVRTRHALDGNDGLVRRLPGQVQIVRRKYRKSTTIG